VIHVGVVCERAFPRHAPPCKTPRCICMTYLTGRGGWNRSRQASEVHAVAWQVGSGEGDSGYATGVAHELWRVALPVKVFHTLRNVSLKLRNLSLELRNLSFPHSPPCGVRHTYTVCVLQGGVYLPLTPRCRIRQTYTVCILQGGVSCGTGRGGTAAAAQRRLGGAAAADQPVSEISPSQIHIVYIIYTWRTLQGFPVRYRLYAGINKCNI
jgi:hypothetical protein